MNRIQSQQKSMHSNKKYANVTILVINNMEYDEHESDMACKTYLHAK